MHGIDGLEKLCAASLVDAASVDPQPLVSVFLSPLATLKDPSVAITLANLVSPPRPSSRAQPFHHNPLIRPTDGTGSRTLLLRYRRSRLWLDGPLAFPLIKLSLSRKVFTLIMRMLHEYRCDHNCKCQSVMTQNRTRFLDRNGRRVIVVIHSGQFSLVSVCVTAPEWWHSGTLLPLDTVMVVKAQDNTCCF